MSVYLNPEIRLITWRHWICPLTELLFRWLTLFLPRFSIVHVHIPSTQAGIEQVLFTSSPRWGSSVETVPEIRIFIDIVVIIQLIFLYFTVSPLKVGGIFRSIVLSLRVFDDTMWQHNEPRPRVRFPWSRLFFLFCTERVYWLVGIV